MTETRITIGNVRVFDGSRVGAAQSVSIADGRFADRAPADSTGSTAAVDAGGRVLVPGLIDAHVHVDAREQLEQLARSGVTTILDLGAPDVHRLDALRHQRGLPTVRSALAPASAPGAFPTTRMGFAASTAVTGPEDAGRFVASG